MPVAFWWLSLVGSGLLLSYALFYRRDSAADITTPQYFSVTGQQRTLLRWANYATVGDAA